MPPGECGCDGFGFLANANAKVNNDSVVDGNLGVNQAVKGRLRFGKRAFVTDGHTVAGEQVRLSDEASVDDVLTINLFRGATAVVRGTLELATLPLRSPFCELPAFSCAPGNDVVAVGPGATALPPGTYGRLMVGDGAEVDLEPGGIYTFCDVRMDRGSVVQSTDRATINVVGDVTIGAGSKLWTPPTVNDLPLILNVGGRRVRISQSVVIEAAITAPQAKLKVQRGGELYGCFCTDRLTTDKNVLLECVDTLGP